MSQAPIAPKLGNPMQDELQRTLGASRPGVSNAMPISAALPRNADPSGGRGFVPPSPTLTPPPAVANVYEGFDGARAQDMKKSAKDSFFGNSKGVTAPLDDKVALAQWFEQTVRPKFEADGHKVNWVDGDKFNYTNHEGNFTVDYGRGAGAADGALAWQAEPGDDATRQRYGTPAGGGVPAIGNQGMAPVMPGQGSDLMAQLMAALEAQQEQPIDPQSLLLEQLR